MNVNKMLFIRLEGPIGIVSQYLNKKYKLKYTENF